MAQTLSSGDIGIAGFDTPAMLNLAVAGHSLKVIAVIYTFKHSPDLARSVLRESTSEADAIPPLYERLSRSFRDFPAPESRGIQNVLDSLLVPKAKDARAEDFIDTGLMEEIRKSGFREKLQGGKG